MRNKHELLVSSLCALLSSYLILFLNLFILGKIMDLTVITFTFSYEFYDVFYSYINYLPHYLKFKKGLTSCSAVQSVCATKINTSKLKLEDLIIIKSCELINDLCFL